MYALTHTQNHYFYLNNDSSSIFTDRVEEETKINYMLCFDIINHSVIMVFMETLLELVTMLWLLKKIIVNEIRVTLKISQVFFTDLLA